MAGQLDKQTSKESLEKHGLEVPIGLGFDLTHGGGGGGGGRRELPGRRWGSASRLWAPARWRRWQPWRKLVGAWGCGPRKASAPSLRRGRKWAFGVEAFLPCVFIGGHGHILASIC